MADAVDDTAVGVIWADGYLTAYWSDAVDMPSSSAPDASAAGFGLKTGI